MEYVFKDETDYLNEKKSYYAIIPANVRYDNSLTPNEKLLYGELTALSNKEGFCYASNQYFADLYTVHKNTISRWISHLQKKEYIKVVQLDNYRRKVYMSTVNPKMKGGTQKAEGGVNNIVNTPTQKAEDNNKDNTTSNTKDNNSGKPPSLFRRCQIDFLEYYQKTKSLPYSFGGKDGQALKHLLKKFEGLFKSRDKPFTEDDIFKGFQYYIRNVNDKWIKANYSLPILNSKWNEITQNFKSNNIGNTNRTEFQKFADKVRAGSNT